MNSVRTIHVVSCHAEGEVGDVIVGGVAPPPGSSLWEQRQFLAKDGTLRNFCLNEPRGGVFRHVNLLVPPIHPSAQMGFLIMEPADTPPMSGSNSICANVLLETGILPISEPKTFLTLEAPGGLVHVEANCKDGRVDLITITNVPSFVDRLDAEIDVPGIGRLKVDTAYGGDSFVIVDAKSCGVAIRPENARMIAKLGVEITKAANEQLGFRDIRESGLSRISFCQFTEPLSKNQNGDWESINAVAIRPGKIDRSPTGTGCSARLAVLKAKGLIAVGEQYVAKSIINSTFRCEIKSVVAIGSRNEKEAVIPSISGRAYITGTHQHMLDRFDPWPQGYRLSDTWPGSNYDSSS